MRPRKPADIEKALLKKGFVKDATSHHAYYHLKVDGKITGVQTYLSHGKKSKEYGRSLMSEVKGQLGFIDTKKAEAFLDCPMTHNQYVEMLKELKTI